MTPPETAIPHPPSRRSLWILLVGLLLVVPLNFVAAALADDTPDEVSAALFDPPAEDGIWLVGNSIFKTGVDPAMLSASLDSAAVDFEYHGGHYTSLWYLIAENALPTIEDQPSLLVWGFRPAYAARPGFRQDAINDTELFSVEGDLIYEALAQPISPRSRSPFDRATDELDAAVSRTGLYELRGQANTTLGDFGLDLGIVLTGVVAPSIAELVRAEVVNGDATLLDVLNNVVTGGEVQLAEERVVDGTGNFIGEDTTDYAGSFIPLTAERIAAQGVDQVVIIWPPRIVAEAQPDPAQDKFVADAIVDLEARGVPVLNLYDDPAIGIDFYASGDHFNPEGRDFITARLAELVRDLNDRER